MSQHLSNWNQLFQKFKKLTGFYWFQLSKNFANFKGRTNRQDFWKFSFIQFFFILFLSFLEKRDWTNELFIERIFDIFFFVTLIPWVAITVRRLHDSGRSGWNLLYLLIPIIGVIALIVFTIDESDEGENKYGFIQKDTLN